jgi:hypothetical protein
MALCERPEILVRHGEPRRGVAISGFFFRLGPVQTTRGALERPQRLTAPGPFRRLLDADVVQRPVDETD